VYFAPPAFSCALPGGGIPSLTKADFALRASAR
jgi:hypothetical protein